MLRLQAASLLPFPAGRPSCTPMFAVSLAIAGFETTHRSAEREKSRDWWAKVVQLIGATMLFVATLGAVSCILALEETRQKGKWTIWSIQVGMCLMTAGMGRLAIHCGSRKTTSAALAYLRVLVLFTVISVIALMVSSMLSLKPDSPQWSQKQTFPAPAIPSEAISDPLSQPLSWQEDSAGDWGEGEEDWQGGEEGMMGQFLMVLGFMLVLAGCVLCAVKLLTSIRQCERLDTACAQLPRFSFHSTTQVQTVLVLRPSYTSQE